MKSKFLLLFSFIVLGATTLSGQIHFTMVDSIYLPIYTYQSPVLFMDYDNDNDLDILLKSPNKNNIWINQGNDSFALSDNLPVTLSSYYTTDINDYDHDGNCDLLKGNHMLHNLLPDSSGFTQKTINTNYSVISNLSNIYNYKGNDLIVAEINNGYYQKYYLGFLDDSLCFHKRDSLPETLPIYFGNYWDGSYSNNFDINNDGYFDIVNTIGNILINNGIDSVSQLRLINNITCKGQYFLKADFNNDGYIDEMGSVKFNSNISPDRYLTYFFKNSQHDTLINLGIGLNGDTASFTNKCVSDFNNDGLVDIILPGFEGSFFAPGYGYQSIIKGTFYKNTGNFNFVKDSSVTGLHSYPNMFIPADYDNDGDLDLLVLHDSLWVDSLHYNNLEHYRYIALYRNDSTPPNTPPSAPLTLWTTMDSTKVIFHWRKATDVETPQATLSYNLMVGTSPKGIDITSPLADTATGFRRVVELGNAQLNNFYILDKSIFSPGDTVYWSVQTIDNGFGYSPFSKESSAIVVGRMEAPDFDTLCGGDSVLWRGSYYKTNGRQVVRYGLDSAFALDLTVYPSYLDEQKVELCSGQSYYWHGKTYYNSGTYQLVHTTTQGCDSIERLVLKVRFDYTNLQSADLCMGDSLAYGGGFITSPGTYDDSLTTIYGCDSVVRLTVAVWPADTLVTLQGDSLRAHSASATVRWLDCNTGSYVPYAWGPLFVPWQNGRYAAELSENGCVWTSHCFEVTGMGFGLDYARPAVVKIRPNPAKDKIAIMTTNKLNINEITLLTLDGRRLLSSRPATGQNTAVLDISTLPQGVYIVEVRTDGGDWFGKVLLE